MTPATHEHHLTIRAAGKAYSLDFRQAFRMGYKLARTRKFRDAAEVFEELRPFDDCEHSATIMLAYCKAGLRDFATSYTLLNAVFSDDQEDKADQLHTAFAYLSVGMWADAIEELVDLARQCPNLPAASLLLGDAFLVQKQHDKAVSCWQLVVERGRNGGAVAAVAQQLIAAEAKSGKKE